jgi:hypothetical protein
LESVLLATTHSTTQPLRKCLAGYIFVGVLYMVLSSMNRMGVGMGGVSDVSDVSGIVIAGWLSELPAVMVRFFPTPLSQFNINPSFSSLSLPPISWLASRRPYVLG